MVRPVQRLGLGRPQRKKRGLNIAAMPNCEWWIDCARTETISFSSGSNVTQINDLSPRQKHLTKLGAGNETIYPVHVPADRGVMFLNSAFDQMKAGDIGDWNFMHNGNGCTIMCLVTVDSAQAANAVILATSSEASTGIGTNLWYFNASQQHNVTTRNGSSQTFYNTGAANSLTKGVPTILSVHIESRTGAPADLVTRSNGATDIMTSNLSTYSAGNSTGPLFVGKLPDAVFKCRMTFKKCVIFSRRISKAEENAILEDWARSENIAITRYAPRDLAVIAGQSNAKGRGAIADTEFAATPSVTNASIFNSNAYTWATLQAGTNNDAYNSSSLGVEMNLAKQFTTLSGKPLNIVKYAADGTAIASWDIANSNFINLQAAMKRAVWQLEDAGYVVKPFFIWQHGESDAGDTNLANLYGGKLQTFLSQILATQGYPQAPTYIVQLHQSPTAVGTDTVRSAQLSTAMTSPYSAYAKFVEVDDIAAHIDQHHLTATSLGAIGNRIARRVLGIAE